MALPTDINPFVQFAGAGGDLGAPIDQSLRFQSQNSTQLTATLGTATDRDRWSFSVWVKKCKFTESTRQVLLSGYGASNDNDWCDFGYETDNGLYYTTNGYTANTNSIAKYRDPAAWQHVVVTWDGSNIKFYSNGRRVINDTQVSGNLGINGPFTHTIGNTGNGTQRINCYMADMYFLDGVLISETFSDGDYIIDDFGRYNIDGVWVPKNYAGSYNTNGFHLTFDSTQANGIGHDSSGSGNHFTASGFETTPISGSNFDNDIDYLDTPTNNFATQNPNQKSPVSLVHTGGNLTNVDSNGLYPNVDPGTMILRGKKYWEIEFVSENGYPYIGISPAKNIVNGGGWYGTNTSYFKSNGGFTGMTDNSTNFSANNGDILSLAFDRDTKQTQFRLNNGTADTRTSSRSYDGDFVPMLLNALSYQVKINYGQRPFIYTPPTGYTKLSANTEPEPAIKNPSDHFQVIKDNREIGVLFYNEGSITGSVQQPIVTTTPIPLGSGSYNGNSFLIDLQQSVTSIKVTWGTTWSSVVQIWCSNDGSTWTDTGQAGATGGIQYTYSISGASFRYVRAYYGSSYGNTLTSVNSTTAVLDLAQAAFPTALYLIKGDASSQKWYWIDPMNGTSAAHRTPLPTSKSAYVPYTSGTSYAYIWNCPDSFSATGITNGYRNETAGFSMVQYTGDDTNPRSIPHGLSKTPGWIILWNPQANDVVTWITDLPNTGTSTENLILNTNEAASNEFSAGTLHAPTDNDNFIVGNSAGGSGVTGVNANGVGYTAFIWAPIDGYSAMGNYTGDGNTDGRIIYCGFKPKFLLIKSQDADPWGVYDTVRDPGNPCDLILRIEDEGSQTDYGGSVDVDILSYGFKIRGNNGSMNGGSTYQYVAFAESPFGGENTAPATAR